MPSWTRAAKLRAVMDINAAFEKTNAIGQTNTVRFLLRHLFVFQIMKCHKIVVKAWIHEDDAKQLQDHYLRNAYLKSLPKVTKSAMTSLITSYKALYAHYKKEAQAKGVPVVGWQDIKVWPECFTGQDRDKVLDLDSSPAGGLPGLPDEVYI